MEPIELRVNRHSDCGVITYTVDKVFPGIGDVLMGKRVFRSYAEAREWARRRHPKIPLLHNY